MAIKQEVASDYEDEVGEGMEEVVGRDDDASRQKNDTRELGGGSAYAGQSNS